MVVSLVSTPQSLVIKADDGAELGAWHHAARGEHRRATPLLLLHGTFSNRFFFGGSDGLAQYLADLGWDAWVGELRGRRGDAPPSWDFEDWITLDAPALARAVLDATGAPRLGWIGHSAGAVIGAGFAARASAHADLLAGLVLMAAPAPHAPGIAHTVTAATGDLISGALGHFPARALRIGPVDEGAGVLRRWSSWNRGRRWIGRDGFDYTRRAHDTRFPALAVAGAADPIAPAKSCRMLLDLLPGERDLIECGRAQGFSRDYTHNALVIAPGARHDVWPAVAAWLEEHLD